MDRQIKEFSMLQRFPFCRIKAALLCKQYNYMTCNKRKILRNVISNVLQQWARCIVSAANYKQTNKKSKSAKYFVMSSPLHLMAKTNKHTLIRTVVSGHVDEFPPNKLNDNSEDWENIRRLVCHKPPDIDSKYSIGRGGMGPGIYVFALIDWDARRERRTQYLVAGGDPQVRLTQQLFEEFAANALPLPDNHDGLGPIYVPNNDPNDWEDPTLAFVAGRENEDVDEDNNSEMLRELI